MAKDEEIRLDSDYSAKPLSGRPAADEIAAAWDADPWGRKFFVNDNVIEFPDGVRGVEWSGKWYVLDTDDWRPDFSQPIEWEPGKKPAFRVRQGDDGSWYAVSDNGELDLDRPVRLVDGHWVEATHPSARAGPGRVNGGVEA